MQPCSLPDWETRVPPPAGVRAAFVVLAVLLSAFSIFVELSSHICAGAFFDPLPDLPAVLSYVALTLCIALNESLLLRAQLTPAERAPAAYRRWLPAALAASGAALVVAVAYTVMFLPIMPAGAIGLIAGIGICAFSPALNLAVLIAQFRRLVSLCRQQPRRSAYANPILCGAVMAVVLLGRPIAIGYFVQSGLSPHGPREAATRWLRVLGAEPDLLALCYRESTPMWVGIGRSLAVSNYQEAPQDVEDARKLYFLVTGHAFETADPSRVVRNGSLWWSEWEHEPVVEDQGGELVGRVARGLSLSQSQMRGTFDPHSETAHCDWTLVFQNSSQSPQEARAEILLPEGGVIDGAWLWVNGRREPAVFGPRDVVRTAYQEVALVQRRDPLLVTARDTGRAMVQCFPVPASGRMRIQLSISSPLVWKNTPAPRLCYTPPAFQQVDFRQPGDVLETIEMRAGGHPQKLSGSGWQVQGTATDAGEQSIARVSLAAARTLAPPTLTCLADAAPGPAQLAPGLARPGQAVEEPQQPLDLLVVLDTTLDMRGAFTDADWAALTQHLRGLPSGSRVRLVDARDVQARNDVRGTGWLKPSDLRAATDWWRGRRYEGGAEPGPSLEWAVQELTSPRRRAAVLWLHGATAPAFRDASSLRARLQGDAAAPTLVSLRCRPGPDAYVDDLAGLPLVFALARRDGVDAFADAVRLADLSQAAAGGGGGVPLGGREPAINGVYVDPSRADDTPAGHLALASAAVAPWYLGASGKPLLSAQKLAIRSHLVTPLSGAVVLDRKSAYAANNLDSSENSDAGIPSVPEPGTIALLATAALMLGAAGVRRKLRGSRSC